MIVAAGQAAAVPGDVAANVATAVRLVALAGSQGVRLLVLPEAFLTGYDPEVFAGLQVPRTDDLDGTWLAPLREAAAVHELRGRGQHAARARGPAARWPCWCSVPTARVAAPYDKQHLDADERPFFAPGDHGASITVDGLELGLSICYDSSFPEHARAAADDGAVAYLCSAAFFPGAGHRRDIALAARALDNGMYVVLAAATGGPHTLHRRLRGLRPRGPAGGPDGGGGGPRGRRSRP